MAETLERRGGLTLAQKHAQRLRREIFVHGCPVDSGGELSYCPACADSLQVAKLLDGYDAAQAEGARQALSIAKHATNGWACYAKRAIEFDAIGRLHQEIAAIERAEEGAKP